MGMKEDGMMNVSINGYTTVFDSFLKKPKQ
jgi:hypothetical protein